MHGGKGSGAPKANRNALKHGGRSAETLEVMATVRAWSKMLEGDNE
jgi:glucans biosynthesis protein